jgi:hypothetical protein
LLWTWYEEEDTWCDTNLGIEVVEPVVAMDIGVQQQFQRVENAHADLYIEQTSLQN